MAYIVLYIAVSKDGFIVNKEGDGVIQFFDLIWSLKK